jgi:hypothetical protein
MSESSCVYVITYVPSGCTEYSLDDIVTTACSEPCEDGVIGEGPCAGTRLTTVSNSCMVYPPEDGLNQEEVDAALRAGRGGATPSRKIRAKDITGHYPAPKK